MAVGMDRHARFESTLWTLVGKAARDPGAFAEIVGRYRAPVANFLMSTGSGESDAEDITQEVFLRVSRPGFMERAARFQGKFRTLLLTVTKRTRTDFERMRHAAKRGGGGTPVSLDALRDASEAFEPPAPDEAADETFDRLWVQNLVRQAVDVYRRQCEERGSRGYALFNDHVFGGMPQEQVAAKHKCTVQDVKNACFAARQKLRQIVEHLIRDTSMTGDDAEERAHLERYLKL
jgi:RNA polymerase sigma factor (sigma-70 family)